MIPSVRNIQAEMGCGGIESMFKEIGDERAFNGILNQIIENIQNGNLKAGAALPAERTIDVYKRQAKFHPGQGANSIPDRSQIPSRAGVEFYLGQKPNSIPGRGRILSRIRRNSSSQTNTRRISYGYKSGSNLHHRRRQRIN